MVWLNKLRYFRRSGVQHFFFHGATSDRETPQRKPELIPSSKMSMHRPPKEVISHLIRQILLNSHQEEILQNTYTLLMKIQMLHPANITTVGWDWTLLKYTMESQERLPGRLLFLQYVVQTLEDDFQQNVRLHLLQKSISKKVLSCDTCFNNVKATLLLQRMLSFAVEVDRSPNRSSCKIADLIFPFLLNIPTRSQREALLNTMESNLLRCKLLEMMFQHSCDAPTSLPLSLSKILYFLGHSSVLLQYQDLTGIESMDQCRHTLEQHNWNIEAAVQDRLNEQEGVPSVFNPPPSRPLQVNTADHRIYSYVVSRPQPRGLLGWGYYFIMLPFRFTYYTLLDIFRFALRFIRPDPRSRVTDPVGDIISFIHMFEEKYGRIHPVFYQGTYSQALNDAKRELRFLLVYLHGDDHQDTDEFCRNTLCVPEVVALINTRMLFWACSTNKPEGYRVSQALRENTYPFLAVIMLKDRRMTVVGRLEGLIQADDLINQLMFIMDANQTYLVSERLEREERNQTQVLRQQQDEAYLASLRADQEKERKKKEERERKKKKEEEVQQQKLAEERRRQTLQEEKERKSECLPPEPHPDDPESVKIIFKLPNDSRVERRFHFTQSLTVIHDFLFSLKESPEKFQIEANFPRRVLPCLPTEEWPNPPTLQEAGLSHTEVLFVQDLTDD
uniref:Fas associated factor family member 2 n=1 Tax=Meleagris gallopavo TaxID=9103 RepID=G1MZN8_MELGA